MKKNISKINFIAVWFLSILLLLSLSSCAKSSDSGSSSTTTTLPTTPGGGTGNSYPGVITGSHSYTGSLQITNFSAYKKILKDNLLCGQSYGYSVDCDDSKQASVLFQFSAGTMPVQSVLALYPVFNYQSAFLPFTGLVYVINANTGFELRTYGTGEGYKKVFSAVGNQPLVVNQVLAKNPRVTITYDGVQVGYTDLYFQW